MKKILLLLTVLALFTINSQAQIIDYDGNVYDTVRIGTQVWLQQNLKVTHYRNGDAIPMVTDGVAWGALTTGGFCFYNNETANIPTYGLLYNYHAVNDFSDILAPAGCHVPTDAEWTILTDYLGGNAVAGGKLKETGTAHWNSPNTGATNETMFTALPGGYRDNSGGYYYFNTYGWWWSTSEHSSTHALCRYMLYNTTSVSDPYYPKGDGFSVRCLVDNTTGAGTMNGPVNVKIYPNPATDRITVTCDNVQMANDKWEVINMYGECVISGSVTRASFGIDLSSVPKGIYVLRLVSGKESSSHKIVLQ